MYRILRANFDGLASDAVPVPPPPRKNDGKAEYFSGRRVTKLQHNKGEDHGAMTVWYVDEDGKTDAIVADLVIGADGLHSTVRSMVHTTAARKEYSGYVTWRGTVPENEVSPQMAAYFERRMTLNLLSRSYIVIYIIPRDSGSFEAGSRLINWVWYQNISDPSLELTEVLTDISGRTHSNTVPAGLVHSEVWRQHLAARIDQMSAPVSKLISSTEKVFVTKVNDALCDQAVFCDGKVVLVGDALSTFRPHLAVATEQGAKNCLGLGRVWNGEISLQEWEQEAMAHATKTWSVSRVLGTWFLRGWVEFFRVLGAHLVALARMKSG